MGWKVDLSLNSMGKLRQEIGGVKDKTTGHLMGIFFILQNIQDISKFCTWVFEKSSA